MHFSHGGDFWENYRSKKRKIDFSSNTNAIGFPDEVKREIKAWKASYYPPFKFEKLKLAIIEFLDVFRSISGEKNSAEISEENIIISSGSVGLIKNFSEVFLCSHSMLFSNLAIIPSPTFSEYERYAKIYRAKIRFMKPKIAGDKIFFDSERIISEILKTKSSSHASKILFLSNPNNPTGSSFSESEVKEIAEACRKSNAVLFLDECFIEFSEKKSSVYFFDFGSDNAFLIRSFTKFFSIPGLRIGYGIGSREAVRKLESIALPWNINVFAHDAAIACLKACAENKRYIVQSREIVKKEKQFLKGELERLGIKVYSSDANFLLIEHSWDSRKLKSWLLDRGLLIRECSNFRYLNERFARVGIRRRKENKILVENIKEYLEENHR